MIDKIDSRLVPLTRELAIQFTKMQAVPGERLLKPHRIKRFEAKLRDGTFGSPNWSKAVIGKDEGEWRLDGQHTSRALADCDLSLFPKEKGVTINTYRLGSLSELPEAFDLFDHPGSARSNADKIGIYTAKFPELAEIDRSFLSKAARGVDYYYRDLLKATKEGPKINVFEAREHGLYFNDGANRTFALWLGNHQLSKHEWMLDKPGIVAEIYSDLKSHPEFAKPFWCEVFDESNPDPDDDTRELSRTLRDWSYKQPRVAQDRFRARAKKAFDRYRRQAGNRPKDDAGVTTIAQPPAPAGGYELHA